MSKVSVREAVKLRVNTPKVMEILREMATYEKAMGPLTFYIFAPMDDKTRRYVEAKGLVRVLQDKRGKKIIWKVLLTPWGREVAMS